MESHRIAFCAVALVTAFAGRAIAGPSATFGDWSVSCSDGLSCSASAFATDSQPSLSSLSITREARTAAEPKIALAFRGDERPEGGVRFWVPGAGDFDLPLQALLPNAAGSALVGEGPVIRDLLPALRRGPGVTVRFWLAGAAREATVSLTGLAAALIFMDEAQHRNGRPSALAVPGMKPEMAAATMPRDIADATALPPTVRKLWEEDVDGCSDLGEAAANGIGFSAAISEMPDDGRIYGLMCGMPGAYNAIYHFYREDGDGRASPLWLPQMTEAGPGVTASAYNVEWDDSAKRMTAFAKGRGIGDCGSYEMFELKRNGFVLVQSRVKDDCDGVLGDVETWPQLWPK